MKNHRVLFFYQAYILTTFLIFYFGPISYPKTNITESAILVILYNVAFTIGYNLAYSHTILYNKNFKSLRRWVKPLIFIGLSVNILLSVAYLISFSGSINFLPDIISGITDPNEAYQKNIEIEEKANLITKLTTLFSPLTYSVIPLSVLFFKKLNKLTTVIFFIAVSLMASTYLIKGTNFLIIFLALTIVIVSFVSGKLNAKGIAKISIMKKALFLLAIFYFFYSISSRMQFDIIPTAIYQISVDTEHVLFKYLPDEISLPLMLGSSYVSQGYYGLSLATTYDFPGTLGLGNGLFLMGKLDPLARLEIWESTYQAQMQAIWDPRIHWHTAYVWFANDIGLYGVIFIMAIIGYFFSLVLRDAIENKSALAIILLPLYAIMLLFMPANNIIFNAPMLFMSFTSLNILWIFSKKWMFKL